MDSHAVQAPFDAFNAAWGDHDLDAAMALITDARPPYEHGHQPTDWTGIGDFAG
jgi:hypothetical protein